MSKRTFLLIYIALVLSLAGYALAYDGVISSSGAPVIDGIKDPNWSVSAEYPIANLCVGSAPNDDADLSCSWWGVWDTDYFYVFVDVNDDSLWNDSAASYEDDSVEFMIDIGNDKETMYGEDDYNYRISWNAAEECEIEEYYQGLRSLIGVECELVTKDGDIGYTVEIKFPWDTLDYLERGIALGDEMGLEVAVNDDDDGGARERQFAWINTENVAWNDPSSFGTVVLGPGLQASNPDPHDGEIGICSGLLQWVAGIFAASHQVYFDTSATNIQNRSGCDVNGVSISDPCYTVSISPNATYYWAIDEVNESGPAPCFWEGLVWSFTAAPATAHSPDPCDGAIWVPVDADLFWGAGLYENGHLVYFDTSEAKIQARSDCEVNGVSCVDPCYPLDWLDTDTTYYWAIDEVNDTGPDPCIWQGDVWEFTTEPVPWRGSIWWERWWDIPGDAVSDLTNNYRYPNNPDEGSEVPIFEDPTGGENYGTRMHGWLYVDDTHNYTFWIASDEQSELWLSPDDDPENAVLIASVPGRTDPEEWTKYPEQQSPHINLQAGNIYYVMALHKEGYGYDHMSVAWSTTTDPCDAEVIDGKYLIPYMQLVSFRPNPADGETDVQSDPVLSWSPGMYAVTHDIYFGTNENTVRNASRTYDPYCVLVKTDLTSSNPTIYDITGDVNVGLLEFDTDYYWRIDDLNTTGPDPCYWKGRTWSFTTGRYHAVEDFEGYEDTDDLDDVWSAHSEVNATSDMACEYHRGDQAMALTYDNSLSYSEAFADTSGSYSLGFDTNWRLQGVSTLSLCFHGIADLRGSYTGSDPYTLEGDGSGIDNTNYDSCYFFYKEVGTTTGLVVEAKVNSIEDTDPSAMAGVMIRDTLNANSIYHATVVTPDDRVIYINRTNTGITSSEWATVDGNTPHWVRIIRTSGMPPKVQAYHANDVNGSPDMWSLIDEIAGIGIGSGDTYIGLCVTSNVYGDMCTAEFSNVTCTPTGNPDSEVDIGSYVYNDPEPMYVTLEDSNSEWTEYYEYGDANVTQTADWTQWRIDLNDFDSNGVDPCDIRTIYIGVGDKDTPSSGSGTVFIDDIRLYAAEFYEPNCDFNHDHFVDFYDFAYLAQYWLTDDCAAPDWCSGIDLDRSGYVDLRDLIYCILRWLWWILCPGECHTWQNGQCIDDQSKCPGECEWCEDGECVDQQDWCFGECETCQDGECIDDQAKCTGECETCQDGDCIDDQSKCGGECGECEDGQCTGCAGECDICEDGECIDDQSKCPGECEWCEEGECVDHQEWCLGECETCQDGECIDDQSKCTGECKTCEDGECIDDQSKCDEGEICQDGECITTTTTTTTTTSESVSLELTLPASNAKLTYNSASPGVLTVECRAEVTSGTVDNTSDISFDCSGIGSSTKDIGAVTEDDPSGDYLCTITFTNLPANNTDFGGKTVIVKYKGTQKDSSDIKVFYSGTVKNWPGATGSSPPNWFHYYKQNAGGGAYNYTSTGRSYSTSGGGDSTVYIGNEAYNGDTYITTTINSGQLEATGWSSTNYYYANFLGVLAHEKQHANNEQNPPGGATDRDSDWLTNNFETGTSSTDPDDKFSAHGKLPASSPWSDDEIYAGGPVEQAGISGANTAQDWANPGSNY